MFSKYITAGVVGSALLASAAFAQSPATTDTAVSSPATTSTSSNSSPSASYTGNWRASKVVGLNVYNDGNESLGSINDLLTDKNGKIVAAVIGVGGFLGVGERYVAIPFEKIKFVTEPVASSAMGGGGAATGSRPTTTTGSTGATGGGMSPAPAAATSAPATPNPWYPDHAVISGTKDELKALPEFKYNNS